MTLSNTSALTETMRAVVWQGQPFNISVLDVPKPTIQSSTDVIVRMSRAAICGSDLHIYRGTMEGQILPVGIGHEGVGYIAEVGSDVGSLNVGDAVIVPFTNPDGHFKTALTPVPYAAFGNGGTLGGTQAEYLRVPHADEGLIPIPAVNYTDPTTNETTSLLNDYVMLSDIFATGWTALDFAGFQLGDTVAIFGAGPVGLMAAYSATLRGASRVYSVDYVAERLRLAASIGAIPINFQVADPVDQILAREPAEVTRSVDCVGFEQVNRNLTVQSDVILQNMLAVTAVNGGMGTVGVYSHGGRDTASQPRASTINTEFNLSLADFWSRGFHWGAGISRPLDLAPQLLHLVASGKARPGFIVSDVVDIEDARAAYARFNNRSATKVVIAFNHYPSRWHAERGTLESWSERVVLVLHQPPPPSVPALPKRLRAQCSDRTRRSPNMGSCGMVDILRPASFKYYPLVIRPRVIILWLCFGALVYVAYLYLAGSPR